MRPLATNECTGKCDWKRAVDSAGQPETLEGVELFRCGSCQSEWTPQETWTPRNADGSLAPEIEEARAVPAAELVGDDIVDAEKSTDSW